MRNLAVLGVFILSSFSVFGQNTDLDKGNAILTQNNIHTKTRTYVDTPDGIYIGTRTESNYRLTYLYKDSTLTLVKSLDYHVVFDYSKTTNSLIVGTKPKNSPFTDVTTTVISLYNLDTHTLTKLADYGVKGYSGIYNVKLNGDTLVCIVNTKRTGRGEVGSDLLPQTTILK